METCQTDLTFRELQHLEREWWYAEWQTGGYQTIWQLRYDDLSYITVNMEHQRVSRTRWSHNKCWHTWTICKILEIYDHILSSCILLHIWWEAIMIPIHWSDLWQEAHMEATHYPCRWESSTKADYNT